MAFLSFLTFFCQRYWVFASKRKDLGSFFGLSHLPIGKIAVFIALGGIFLKPLLLPLTLNSLLVTITAVQATIRPDFYLPQSNACAVYRGGIEREKDFVLWVENQRQLTIKADQELKVAVTSKGRVIPPFQVAPLPDSTTAQFSYRTSITGNHVIKVRGVSDRATVTVCLQ